MQPEIDILKYNSGKVEAEIPYVDGKVHGTERCWYENGQIESEIEYEKDKYHGTATWWHEDGKLRCQANFINGKQHCISGYWDKYGYAKRLRVFQSGNEMLEFCLDSIIKNIQTNKPLFSKSQFKQLCNQQ